MRRRHSYGSCLNASLKLLNAIQRQTAKLTRNELCLIEI